MFQDFQYRHIPALFTAGAQCWGTIWPLIDGTRSVLLHYGLPARIANVPETWPVWHVGNARTACLGILMFIFYSRRQYAVLDTFLVVIGGYLGPVDCILLWNEGLKSTGVFRLFGSLIFAAMGFAGLTQGSSH
ncbi:hypothetical protein EDB81DRAFT_924521 [Dactylonectria macrodidyma]|uniref:Uncharacterized protein n=1 Tax=Dactylonectria macrodidyma TaxID=307937 RepID=A0A9P9JC58_9HYPO|nr:hypothetical protein EDB81DRAFT_924521 [Dactylonectria macrodidyma]